MKRFFYLLLIIACASHFDTNEVFAQKSKKPNEAIIVEFLVPNSKEANKIEIKINRTSKTRHETGGEGRSACSHCSPEEAAALPSYYLYTARAFRIGKDKANIGFEIEVDGECKTRKIFTVYRNQQTKIQLKCGVSLNAYYGFESEEAN